MPQASRRAAPSGDGGQRPPARQPPRGRRYPAAPALPHPSRQERPPRHAAEGPQDARGSAQPALPPPRRRGRLRAGRPPPPPRPQPHLEGVVEVRVGEGVAVEVRHGGDRRALRSPGGSSSPAAPPDSRRLAGCPPPRRHRRRRCHQPLRPGPEPAPSATDQPPSADLPKWPPRK